MHEFYYEPSSAWYLGNKTVNGGHWDAQFLYKETSPYLVGFNVFKCFCFVYCVTLGIWE